MKIRKFSKDDLIKLNVQEQQKHELNLSVQPPETSFSIERDGMVLGVFGFVEMYPGRAAVFAFVSKDAGRYMTAIVRALRRTIEWGAPTFGFERLEMSVIENFPAGDRMARLLGFEYEGMMRKYYKGRNYKLFARVK